MTKDKVIDLLLAIAVGLCLAGGFFYGLDYQLQVEAAAQINSKFP